MRIASLLCFIAAVAATSAPAARATTCTAASPARTTALVELYTSEGCDSCPPADQWLSALGSRGYAPDRVVPIALHVDYWDYIGWKDPYAKREFATRQRKQATLKRARVIYTPQVLLQGQDFRGWGGPAFDQAVARINALPPKASITLTIDGSKSGILAVDADVKLLNGAVREDAALYLAAYENKLVSEVRAGENRGRTLTHDYVVLEWSGPIGFGAGDRLQERRDLPLLPKAVRAHSGVVGFVQDRRTGDVLQALMLPACPAPKLPK